MAKHVPEEGTKQERSITVCLSFVGWQNSHHKAFKYHRFCVIWQRKKANIPKAEKSTLEAHDLASQSQEPIVERVMDLKDFSTPPLQISSICIDLYLYKYFLYL